jgi:hypothetical protein
MHWRVPLILARFNKLLEAIGVLTKEETKKSQSRLVAYQDATTESLSTERDNEASYTGDAPESTERKPDSTVGLAIFKVRIDFFGDTLCDLTIASQATKDCTARSFQPAAACNVEEGGICLAQGTERGCRNHSLRDIRARPGFYEGVSAYAYS